MDWVSRGLTAILLCLYSLNELRIHTDLAVSDIQRDVQLAIVTQ